MKPGRFFVKIILAPEMRGRGLGTQMFADALHVAREHGATHLESNVDVSLIMLGLWLQNR